MGGTWPGGRWCGDGGGDRVLTLQLSRGLSELMALPEMYLSQEHVYLGVAAGVLRQTAKQGMFGLVAICCGDWQHEAVHVVRVASLCSSQFSRSLFQELPL